MVTETESNTHRFFSNLKFDLPAGLVVFLVALPLCLGIALASGAPLFSGIIAGVIGGIVVGSISGSNLGVSGPAAGLAVIVFDAIQNLGYPAFLLAVVLAGILQIGAGYARAGIIGYYFPTSVIKGMLAGIGVVLMLKQIPHALGYDRDPEGDWGFLQADGHNTITEIYYSVIYNSPGAIVITIVSLLILIAWNSSYIRSKKLLSRVPAPLIVVVLGVLINWLFQGVFPSLVLKNEAQQGIENFHLVNIPVFDGFSGFISSLQFPDFSQLGNYQVYMTAITMMVVASLETLLCVEATDKLDPYRRVTPTNRELKAQGAGNLISGLIGGLPVTQVVVRSSANIDTGGRSKTSTIFHGILLAIFVLSLPQFLNLIPLSCLAAILLVVGYKLAKISLFKSMYKLGIDQFIPFVVTVLGIMFTDLLKGIVAGLLVSIFFILRSNFRTPFYFHKEDHHEGEKFRIILSEEVSFLNKGSILIMLENIPKDSDVTIDGSRSNLIDHDVKEMIQDFILQAPQKNIKLRVEGIAGIDDGKGVALNPKGFVHSNGTIAPKEPA